MEQEAISVEQIRAARALLGLSQSDLAARSGFSSMTIKRAEGIGQPYPSPEAIAAIRAALEAAGVLFVGTSGVRLKCVRVQSIGEWELFECFEGADKPRAYYISRLEERDGITLPDLESPRTEDRAEAERWALEGNWPEG